MREKIQGEPLRPDPTFAFCQAPFLMTFAMGGIPHAGSQQEFIQTHIHRVCDAIQPSHPLSSPSPPAPMEDFKNIKKKITV